MATGIAEGTIALTINGSTRVVSSGTTLADLLSTLGLDPRMIVVEHNRTIVRNRDQFSAFRLADGDTLELVHFVGGG